MKGDDYMLWIILAIYIGIGIGMGLTVVIAGSAGMLDKDEGTLPQMLTILVFWPVIVAICLKLRKKP